MTADGDEQYHLLIASISRGGNSQATCEMYLETYRWWRGRPDTTQLVDTPALNTGGRALDDKASLGVVFCNLQHERVPG